MSCCGKQRKAFKDQITKTKSALPNPKVIASAPISRRERMKLRQERIKLREARIARRNARINGTQNANP